MLHLLTHVSKYHLRNHAIASLDCASIPASICLPFIEGIPAWKQRCARSPSAKSLIEPPNSTAQIFFSLQASLRSTAAYCWCSVLLQIGAQQAALSMHLNTGLIVVSVIGLVVL